MNCLNRQFTLTDLVSPYLSPPPFFRLVVFFWYSGFLHQKTDRHDITEILLKVALNTITPNPFLFKPISLVAVGK